VASGCDNVEWGGAEIGLREPPPAVIGAAPDTVDVEQERLEAVPEDPVLYVAERDSTGLRLIPVGAVARDSVRHFPSDSEAAGYRARFARQLLPTGAEFVLFARGVRVGSFTVASVETDASFCVARPAARGIVALIPEALEVTRFLALPREAASSYEWRPFEIVEMDRAQRDATLSLPIGALADVGAERPANFLDTRWDMQAIRLAGEDAPMFAVSHLIRDRMRIERPPPSAFSLFMLGVPSGEGYEAGFVWYRPVSRQGKGAPRFFEQMDWDGDSEAEVLLEVLGEEHRWFAAVDRRGGEWTLVHEDPCGAAAPPVSASG
jgi:hypothetical protein